MNRNISLCHQLCRVLLLCLLLITVLPCTAAPSPSDAPPAAAAISNDVTVGPNAGFHTLLLAPSQKVKFLLLQGQAVWKGNDHAYWGPLFGKTNPKTEIYTAPSEAPPGGLDIIELGTPDRQAPSITIVVSISRPGPTTSATSPAGPSDNLQEPAMKSLVPLGTAPLPGVASYSVPFWFDGPIPYTNDLGYRVVALRADSQNEPLVECYRHGPFLPVPTAATLLKRINGGQMQTPDGAGYAVVSSDWVQTTIPEYPWTLGLTLTGPIQPKVLARILKQTSDVPRGKFSGVKVYTRTFNLVRTRYQDFYRVTTTAPMPQDGHPAVRRGVLSPAASQAFVYSYTTMQIQNGRAGESHPFWAQVLLDQHPLKSPNWLPVNGALRLRQDPANDSPH